MDTSAVLGALRLADAVASVIQAENMEDNRIGLLRSYGQATAIREHLHTAIRLLTPRAVVLDTSSPAVE